MRHNLTNQTPSRGLALLMAIHIALSIALMAFFLTCCGCTVCDDQPKNEHRRRVDVKVNIDLPRRPACPDGNCPYRNARRTQGQFEICNSQFAICNSPAPIVDLPLPARCRNYAGGSCVCASTISLLRWQGRDDLAAGLRNSCVGGQSAGSLHVHLDRLGVRYASTTSGDAAFLEWAIRTRRGCGITYYPMHFVNLVDLTANHATLLDNNRVGQYITMPRDEFLRRWRGYGGWATAVVYSPAAPLARR